MDAAQSNRHIEEAAENDSLSIFTDGPRGGEGMSNDYPDDRYPRDTKADLEALRINLNLRSLTPSTSGNSLSSPQMVQSAPIVLQMGDDQLPMIIPTEARSVFRQRFKDLGRREKRRAADAGNAASTSQQIGGSVGAALATGGLVALATASGPLAIAAIFATAAGSLVAIGGFAVGHALNKRKSDHEERMDRYNDIAEDLR